MDCVAKGFNKADVSKTALFYVFSLRYIMATMFMHIYHNDAYKKRMKFSFKLCS